MCRYMCLTLVLASLVLPGVRLLITGCLWRESLSTTFPDKHVDLAADHGGIVASLGDLEQPLAIM